MRFASDAVLLAKKILVGVIVALIPLLILGGGLWLARTVLERG